MLTFVKKVKQKVAVTHENGKINFFKVVNKSINYEFQIAGDTDSLFISPILQMAWTTS